MKLPKAGANGKNVPTTTITTVTTIVRVTDEVLVTKSQKGNEREYKRNG
jgi:hypothetical protein